MNRRILGWQNRNLSFGSRYTLITSIFQSLPVYLLSTINLPKGVIQRLYQLMARFFWGRTRRARAKHWVAWDNMCFPTKEGVVGFRSLYDIRPSMLNYGGSLGWEQIPSGYLYVE